MKKFYYSRNEAAEVLGVHPQTVTNYAARGFIRKTQSRTSQKKDYYLREDVDTLAATLIKEPEMRVDVEDLRREYRREVIDLRLKIKGIRALTDAATIDNLIYFGEVAGGAIELVSNICGESLPLRDKYIIQQALALRGINTAAEEFKLTAARVRQILNRAIRRMTRLSKTLEVKIGETQRENEELKEKNRLLAKENNALKEAGVTILTDQEREDIENHIKASSEYVARNWTILNTNIADLKLSVRTYNCMRAANIKTVAELVCLSRNELMRFRNFGRKSLAELDGIVEKLGLQFNAPVGEMITKERSTYGGYKYEEDN